VSALGDVLKSKRDLKGWSAAKAADEADVSPAYLSKLEAGNVKRPSPHILHQLAGALEIPYIELMRLAGYIVPSEGAPVPGVIAALMSEGVSEAEAADLMEYLKFRRGQQRGRPQAT
jgi:HTH-type transcriptional regulator, competence development regulator